MNTLSPVQSEAVAKNCMKLQLALSIIVFIAAATVPYSWLIEHFGYDDILREPAADILTKFHAGGSPLILAWFGFAMSALLFIPVALGFKRLLDHAGVSDLSATPLAIASAIAQAIGLLRWVLVVPGLASQFVSSNTSPATKEALAVVFDAVHHYGGMVIGEMVGQILLLSWTGLISFALLRSGILPRWLSAIGMATVPLWVVGQTELLHSVVPSIPAFEVIPAAFMGWEAWLAAIAVALLVQVWRDRPGHHQQVEAHA